MVTIYTMNIRLEEPVSALFSCEFCNHEFMREGKITVNQKIETWYRNINNSDISSAIASAKAKIIDVHEFIETNLNFGGFPQNWSENQSSVRFVDGRKCPNCNYHQQITLKKPWEAKRKISLGILLIMPMAIYATIIYALISSFIENNSPILLLMAILFVALLPLGYLLINRIKTPNKDFMKKHALSKNNIPPPRKPIISYGSIQIVYE